MRLVADRAYVPAYLQAGQALMRLDRLQEATEILRNGIVIARQQGNDHAASEMSGLLASLE
jgi:hypothetical protein